MSREEGAPRPGTRAHARATGSGRGCRHLYVGMELPSELLARVPRTRRRLRLRVGVPPGRHVLADRGEHPVAALLPARRLDGHVGTRTSGASACTPRTGTSTTPSPTRSRGRGRHRRSTGSCTRTARIVHVFDRWHGITCAGRRRHRRGRHLGRHRSCAPPRPRAARARSASGAGRRRARRHLHRRPADGDAGVRQRSLAARSTALASDAEFLDRAWVDAVHPDDRAEAAAAAWADCVAAGPDYESSSGCCPGGRHALDRRAAARPVRTSTAP